MPCHAQLNLVYSYFFNFGESLKLQQTKFGLAIFEWRPEMPGWGLTKIPCVRHNESIGAVTQ